MKQRLTAATLALLLVGAFGAGAVNANGPKDHPSGPPSDARSGNVTTNPSTSNHTVSYSVRCTPANPGGYIKVQAKVLHAVRGKKFTASALASFGTVPLSLSLSRAGKSFVAVGKIPVPAAQAAGPVSVTVSIFYEGTTPFQTTCTSQISPAAASSSNHDASPNARSSEAKSSEHDASSEANSSDDDASPHSHSE